MEARPGRRTLARWRLSQTLNSALREFAPLKMVDDESSSHHARLRAPLQHLRAIGFPSLARRYVVLNAFDGARAHMSAAAPVAQYVSAGTTTSSPGPTPAASIATCSAAVPLETAIPYLHPCLLANASSKRRSQGPLSPTPPPQ